MARPARSRRPPAGEVLDLEVIARGTIPRALAGARPLGAPLPEYLVVRPLQTSVGLLQVGGWLDGYGYTLAFS